MKELKRATHPKGVFTVNLGERAISQDIINGMVAFFVLYLLISIISIFIMCGFGYDIMTSISSVAATIGNIGPGLGNVGPSLNYSTINPAGKLLLSSLMIIGRLELFTVVVIFTPSFWKR